LRNWRAFKTEPAVAVFSFLLWISRRLVILQKGRFAVLRICGKSLLFRATTSDADGIKIAHLKE
jgi:hypothetical protein